MPPRATSKPKTTKSPKATASSPTKKTAPAKSRPVPVSSPRRSMKAKDGMRRCTTPGGRVIVRTFALAEKKGNEFVAGKGRFQAPLPSIGAKKTSRAAFKEKGLEKKDGAVVKFYMMELRRDPTTGNLMRNHSENPVFECEVRQSIKEKKGVLAENEISRAKEAGRRPNLSLAQRSVNPGYPILVTGHQ
jgi:hypothetical protein